MDAYAKSIHIADPWIWMPPVLALAALVTVQLTGSNTSLFLWLNGLDTFTGDGMWSGITILGDGLVAFVLADAFLEKFGGDSIDEIRRHFAATADLLRSRFSAARSQTTAR